MNYRLTQLRSRRTGMQVGRLKKGPQSLGRSRGGITTKLHLAICGISSSILRIIMTAGHRSDCPYGPPLVDGFRPRAILADRAYDTNTMIAKAAALKAELVVPSKSNRKFPRCIAKNVYKRRNIIERVIGRLKDFRRVSMRFEKTDSNYFGFVYIAALLYNLNPTVNTT